MGQVTHEQANLMLRLYELRREPRLREARAWYMEKFTPATPEDVMKICPPGSEANAFFRMVVSYWEMAANIVSQRLIDEEFFFENSGEQWIVWERLKPVANSFRERFKNPHAWKKLEEHATRLEAWREKRAPGTSAATREMMKQMMAAQAAKSA